MSTRLDIGAGQHSDYEYQIDLVKHEKTTHIVDVAVEPLPFPDNFFDEVRVSQLMEHIPTVLYWKEKGKWCHRYPRIELMREIHRVLKPEGLAVFSTPVDFPYWAQDPTHVDVPVPPDFFGYFCGGWESDTLYGINFKFTEVSRSKDGFNSTVVLKKT